MNHTSGSQDHEITAAISHGEAASSHVSNLVGIIEDLETKIDAQKEEIERLEGELVDSQEEVKRLNHQIDSEP